MDFLTLRGVLAECRALRGESLVAATALDDPAGLALHFAPSGVRLHLFPLASPALFLAPPPPGAPRPEARRGGVEPPPFASGPFAGLLRGLHERFLGGRLAAVDTTGMSRVALFTFERRDRFGDPVTATLAVELIGAFGNLILIDGPAATGRILERLQADRGRKDPRPLNRGAAWLAPGARGVDLLLAGAPALAQALAAAPAPGDTAGWVTRLRETAAGLSPPLARALLEDVGGPGGRSPDEMAARLTAALEARLAAADAAPATTAAELSTRLATPESASARARAAWLAGPQPRGRADADPAAGASLERHALTQAVQTRLTDAGRRLERLREELARRPDGETARRRAEALLAYAHEVPRGAAEVRLPLGEAAEPGVIPLDPRRSAADNAANYFREARKAERAALDLPAKVRAAEAQMERLTDFRRRLAVLPATDTAGLAALGAEWRGEAPAAARAAARPGSTPGPAGSGAPSGRAPGAGAAGKGAAAPLGGSAARGPRAPSASMLPRRYEMPGGWSILVGRTEVGNDYLTHELAAPHDLWFHAHGAAGSHVVLKGPDKKAQPDKSLILAAAALAALNSKARHAAKVPVIYAEKRHVRKPRGGKPGLAAVTHEKSIMVRPGEPATREEA